MIIFRSMPSKTVEMMLAKHTFFSITITNELSAIILLVTMPSRNLP